MLMERIHNIGKISVVAYTVSHILVNHHWFAMMLQMQNVELTLLTTDVRYADIRLEHSDQGRTEKLIHKDQRNFRKCGPGILDSGLLNILRFSYQHQKILFFQCVFTTVSSMIGFILNVGITHSGYLRPNHWKQEVEYYWEPEKHCWAEYEFKMRFYRHDWGAEPDWGRGLPCRSAIDDDIHDEQITAELSLVQILTIESFLFFGKTSRILAAKNFI